MEIKITTGTYNTPDYRVVKSYTNEKSALKFLKSIGYAHNEFFNTSFSSAGINYKVSIN
jgi:hypothetical protein